MISRTTTLVLTAPVDAGAEPGEPLTMVEVLLIFVGAPLGLFVLISLLVVAPSLVRGGRQASRGWLSEPVWFGGPEQAEPVPGPASGPVSGPAPEVAEAASRQSAGGGASARW